MFTNDCLSQKVDFEKTFLSEIPGQAHVAVLEPDATNIINVVEGGYEGITTSIQVEIIHFPFRWRYQHTISDVHGGHIKREYMMQL